MCRPTQITQGVDTRGRNNHERVGAMNSALRSLGVSTWFDSSAMNGDIAQCMATGIDSSSVFVVFITGEYIRKCAECGADDNCHAEFSYAVQRKGVQKVVAVVMEPELKDTAKWQGPIGLRLNGLLYVDFTEDTSRSLPVSAKRLREAVRSAAQKHNYR